MKRETSWAIAAAIVVVGFVVAIAIPNRCTGLMTLHGCSGLLVHRVGLRVAIVAAAVVLASIPLAMAAGRPRKSPRRKDRVGWPYSCWTTWPRWWRACAIWPLGGWRSTFSTS